MGGRVTGTKPTIADISLQITAKAAKRAGGHCRDLGNPVGRLQIRRGGNQCGISWPGARKPGCRRSTPARVEDAPLGWRARLPVGEVCRNPASRTRRRDTPSIAAPSKGVGGALANKIAGKSLGRRLRLDKKAGDRRLYRAIPVKSGKGGANVKKHSNEEPCSCGGYGPFCSSCCDSTADAKSATHVYDPFCLFFHEQSRVDARRPKPHTRRGRIAA